jgi:hypothetical protein
MKGSPDMKAAGEAKKPCPRGLSLCAIALSLGLAVAVAPEAA